MDSGFQTVLLEGDFNLKPDGLWVTEPTSTLSVTETLTPLLGKSVQAVVQFFPPLPMDLQRWGGGCCHWQTTGHCPVGHHENPGLMLDLCRRGVLCLAGGNWSLLQDSGELQSLHLSDLDGHRARILMLVDLPDAPAVVTSLEQEARRLREFLSRLGRGV